MARAITRGIDPAWSHAAAVDLRAELTPAGFTHRVDAVYVVPHGETKKTAAQLDAVAATMPGLTVSRMPALDHAPRDYEEVHRSVFWSEWHDTIRELEPAPPDLVLIEGFAYQAGMYAHQLGGAGCIARSKYPYSPVRIHDPIGVSRSSGGAAGPGGVVPKQDRVVQLLIVEPGLRPLIEALKKDKESPGDVADAYFMALAGLYELDYRLRGSEAMQGYPEHMRGVLSRMTTSYPEAPVSRLLRAVR